MRILETNWIPPNENGVSNIEYKAGENIRKKTLKFFDLNPCVSFQPLSHLHILIFSPRPRRQFALHPPYRVRHPSSRPDEAPHEPIDDTNGDENAEDVSHHAAFASTGVEEAIGVEALGGDRDVRQREVEGEDDDEEW